MSSPEKVLEAVVEELFDFESFFRSQYGRISLAIARVVRDPARAEEIAVEAFWKLWRNSKSLEAGHAAAWLYRTALRLALDELRKDSRRLRWQSRGTTTPPPPTPEETHAAGQERDRVRLVLAALNPRQAELLLLRGNDLSYAEVAAALGLNPSSVGTLIGRAQQAFRKEYVTRYGEPGYER